jgi:diadenosine tetraphosphate (Ap4A) HIT family hydrolase
MNLHELPGEEVVWQFAHSVAFLGPWQYYHGYCVLVSRRHAPELTDLPDDERRAFSEELCLLGRAVARAVAPRKLNWEMLGNQVAHPHWHLFPRSHDDPDTLRAVWLALDRADRDPAERRRLEAGPVSRVAITALLRQHLQALIEERQAASGRNP